MRRGGAATIGRSARGRAPVPVNGATAVALLFAIGLALVLSLVLAALPLPLALVVGLLAVVLFAAVANNELALYLLIFSMLLGPQLLAGELGSGGVLGRGLTFRLDDVLLGIVGLAWLAKTALYKELGPIFRTPLNWPIVAYSAAALMATGLGMVAGRVRVLGGSLFVLKYIQYFVIYFMVANNLRERRQFSRFLLALLATAAVTSFIAILQIPSGVRVSAPFEGPAGEPNTFGGYLVLILSLVGGLYLTAESLRHRMALGALAVLITVPLLFTLSRSSYLALGPLAAALFVWSDRKRLLGGLLALALLIVPLATPRVVLDRILYTVMQPADPGQIHALGFRLDTSTSDRLRSWSTAIVEDWPKHPLFGFGVTGYRFLDAQYPRVLVETGIVGLLAFLWLQASLFRRARAILRDTRDPLYRGVTLGLLAGFVALVTHAIGANTFVIVRIMEPFWFLTGMVMMVPQLEPAGAGAADARAPAAAPRRVVATRRP